MLHLNIIRRVLVGLSVAIELHRIQCIIRSHDPKILNVLLILIAQSRAIYIAVQLKQSLTHNESYFPCTDECTLILLILFLKLL